MKEKGTKLKRRGPGGKNKRARSEKREGSEVN